MMSLNRQDKKDRLRSELDFKVNRWAENEIQGLANKLHLPGEQMGDVEDLLRRQTRPEIFAVMIRQLGARTGYLSWA